MTKGFQKGYIPWNKGKYLSEETKRKMSKTSKKKIGDKNPFYGKHHTEEVKKKISKSMSKRMKGNIPWNKGLKGWNSRENHYRWNLNRNEVRYDRRNDPEYKQWVKKCRNRDNHKCKIGNKDCKGRLEVHHILDWTKFPELRYNINNGITLCQFHHPRKRDEKQRLIPLFNSLVEIK